MSRTNTALIKAALATLHASGVDRLSAPLTAGCGAVFMLHSVAPDTGEDFEPNRILRITPEFLEAVLDLVRELGFDIVSLDEIPSRLEMGQDAKPFVSFTFDDGYKDNREFALPIMRRHGAPLAIYVPSDFADGTGDLWWLGLEHAIRRLRKLDVRIGAHHVNLPATTVAEKNVAFHKVYWALRQVPEDAARRVVAQLCLSAGYDASGLCRELIMNWDEVRAIASDPLVTIGAHTDGHYALAKLSEQEAWRQLRGNVHRLQRELGRPCRHMSFPYGSQDACGEREAAMAQRLGMRTAVTTSKGLLLPQHRNQLTALPRLSLNGDFQDTRFVRTLLSGAPFALARAFESVRRLPSAARAITALCRHATST